MMAAQDQPDKHPSQVRHDHYDRGATGGAMVSRPAGWFSPDARARGSDPHGKRVEVVRYVDATVFDRMHARSQLSDRQHAAAVRLAERWTAAGLNPRMSSIIKTIGSSGEGLDDGEPYEPDPAADPDETARDRYRRLMLMLPGNFAARLEDMLLGRHPGIDGLAGLQAGLDWLADFWKLEDDGEPRGPRR